MINFTKIIQSHDPRSPSFNDAIQNETDSLDKIRTWVKIFKSSTPQNANVLGGIFVLSIKYEGTPHETLNRQICSTEPKRLDEKFFWLIVFLWQDNVPIFHLSHRLFWGNITGQDFLNRWQESVPVEFRKRYKNIFDEPCFEFPIGSENVLKLSELPYRLPQSGD